jgi:Zn-dependent protease/predicted transcriptional regulator
MSNNSIGENANKRRFEMLRGGIPIGKAFGISLRLHYSWFFIFALVTWALAGSYFPSTYPTWSLSARIAAGLITSVLFFGSVLVHELMHSIVAQRQGISVQSITLFIFGGVSQITSEPKQPKDEFRMAIIGPLSSLLIGGVLFGIYFGLRDVDTFAAQFITAIAYWLGYINLLLGAFNLIPGFPLDGGRVFRSLLWWRSGNLKKATRTASNIGRAVGFIFIFVGIWLIFTGNWVNGIWLALIGWFLESAAVGSYQQLLLQEMLKGHVVREVMSSDCAVIPPDTTIDHLVHENILTSGRRCFPVVSDSQILGLMTLHNVKAVPREQWRTETVREAMTPFDKLKWVRSDEELSSILRILTEDDINQVPVVQDGKIVGMVNREDLLNFVNIRSGLGI